jgi:hypothetical protein
MANCAIAKERLNKKLRNLFVYCKMKKSGTDIGFKILCANKPPQSLAFLQWGDSFFLLKW